MARRSPEVLRCDCLVVGSGIAGLWFAYRAGQHLNVLVVTKKEDTESNTNYAQGGIAAAFAENDSPGIHAQDTIDAGKGLADSGVVRLVTQAGPALVRELSTVGVKFTTYADSRGNRRFDLGREGGHRRRRIVHAQDLTGYEIERGLLKAVRLLASVRVSEQHFVLDLARGRNGECVGAYVLDRETGRVVLVQARATVLAAGGFGQVYLHTTNPPIATGDGVAMAFRGGARLGNMEFIQFHPTSLYGAIVQGRAFLISEALRGEGAILRTRDGRAFMDEYHSDASLAPRDAVARAIDSEMRKRGDEFVLLDATHLDPERTRRRFPNICQTCLRFGIDVTTEPIPVVPAAHYACGGVLINSWGETSVPGLFAAGECACSGLHGANRLASNSLLEALVFAERAAQRLESLPKATRDASGLPMCDYERPSLEAEAEAAGLKEQLRRTMWASAGIVRSDAGLAGAQGILFQMAREHGLGSVLSVSCREVVNMLLVSRLVVLCCRKRTESRGLHFNRDHPSSDGRFAKNTVVTPEELEDS